MPKIGCCRTSTFGQLNIWEWVGSGRCSDVWPPWLTAQRHGRWIHVARCVSSWRCPSWKEQTHGGEERRGKLSRSPNSQHCRVLKSMQIKAPEIFQHFQNISTFLDWFEERTSPVRTHWKAKRFFIWLYIVNAVYENDNVRSMIECLINIWRGTISNRSIRIGIWNSRINQSQRIGVSFCQKGPSERNKSDKKRSYSLDE